MPKVPSYVASITLPNLAGAGDGKKRAAPDQPDKLTARWRSLSLRLSAYRGGCASLQCP
jgi:hypothetical protein